MQKFLAAITAVITLLTAVLGLASYVGMESMERYHVAGGFISLALVLLITHQMYHGINGRK